MTRVKETLGRWWKATSAWLDQWAEYLEAEEIRKRREALDRLERHERRQQNLISSRTEQRFGGKSVI